MAANTSTVYDFTLNDIDGKPVSLSQYKGKVIMLVNTASFCGNTAVCRPGTDVRDLQRQGL